jgi:hypothetical protein
MAKVIAYFASDLSDMAVHQRVRMLRTGGADVRLVGFRRTAKTIASVSGVPAHDLGRTFEGRLIDRMATVLGRSVFARRRLGRLMADADVVLARNLDMLTIANAARGDRPIPLIYECLDIHRALLGNGVPARLLRGWEKRLLAKAAGLVVSSPGFVTHYFATLGIALPPIVLIENKQVANTPDLRPTLQRRAGPPWKIGWFGNIRCIESFQLFLKLARRHPDLVEIDLRGRPTGVLQDLIDQYLPLPNMRFGGAYTHDDLAAMYHDVHFMWAVDYHHRGGNSNWLLPNRIYEAGRYNCPIIALAQTQTALWLQAHDTGVLLDEPASDLARFFGRLTPSDYHRLHRSAAAIPIDDLVHSTEACHRFVNTLVATDSAKVFDSQRRG